MVNYAHHFLSALLLTVFVETLVILFFLKKIYKTDLRIPKIISASIFANLATIPYVWFVFPFILSQPIILISSEIFAFVAEAIFYKIFLKLLFKQAVLVSFLANLASYFLGRILLG